MKIHFSHPSYYAQEKEKILSREDLSQKGEIDAEIRDLVDAINENSFFCTTSSCAGRITLLERKSSRKIDAKWLFTSHQPVSADEIISLLQSKSDVWLMQESCILHVFCQTLESAQDFLSLCHSVGFKRSGITSLNKKIIIEMMGNEKVEALLIKDGKTLIKDDSLPILIEECNARMLKNRERMDILLQAVRDYNEKIVRENDEQDIN
ncbi:MAG: tRNA-wybutosine modification methyltransferase TYW3 [Candidatus Woesearchaeota archaeon]